MATTALSPLERFHELNEKTDALVEFDGTRIIELSTASLVHSTIQGNVLFLLKQLARAKSNVFVGASVGFQLVGEVRRIPDVAASEKSELFSLERRQGWYVGAPALAVEIVSPVNTAEDLDLKTRQYFEAGSQSVWVVYPETRHVLVYRSDGRVENRREGESITEPELFGEAAIPVSDFFADLET